MTADDSVTQGEKATLGPVYLHGGPNRVEPGGFIHQDAMPESDGRLQHNFFTTSRKVAEDAADMRNGRGHGWIHVVERPESFEPDHGEPQSWKSQAPLRVISVEPGSLNGATPHPPILRQTALVPGWSPADVTPYGPGWKRYVPGKGMLKVGYENHQYHWRLQTGPAKGTRPLGGFTDPRKAMKDADRVTGMSAPGLFEALTTDELLALYRELHQAYPRHRTGTRREDERADELAWVRDDVFGQMEIAALNPAYNGPDPSRFAQACLVAFTGATRQLMAASPNRESWLRPPPARQGPATRHGGAAAGTSAPGASPPGRSR